MLELGDISLRDDGQCLQLGVDVSNPTAARLYACASVSAVRYEPATRLLEVQLAPAKRGTAPGNHVLSRVIAIDPQQRLQIRVTVPRVVARLGAGAGRAAARFERLPAHEAAEVEVSVAWSDSALDAKRVEPDAWAKGRVRSRARPHRGLAP